jgi:citrate synthase
MQQGKIKSNIDFHCIKDNKLIQYVNYGSYKSIKENWVSLEELFIKDIDFLDLLFLKLTGKEANEKEKKLLLKTLMILSFGTGCHPPSVMVPKLVASTTKNKEFAIINGLISGLATVGTDHLGAVIGCMKSLVSLKDKMKEHNVKEVVEEFVEQSLKNKEKIRGFGHPVYRKDPRPGLLLNEILKTYEKNIYIDIYVNLAEKLYIEKGIKPNIDAILALSYLCMDFEPEQGIYLSFLSRSLSMFCHILEEFPKKPFSFMNEIVSMEDFYESEDKELTDKIVSEVKDLINDKKLQHEKDFEYLMKVKIKSD